MKPFKNRKTFWEVSLGVKKMSEGQNSVALKKNIFHNIIRWKKMEIIESVSFSVSD